MSKMLHLTVSRSNALMVLSVRRELGEASRNDVRNVALDRETVRCTDGLSDCQTVAFDR